MTHISKYPLDKKLENEIFTKFWHSLATLRDADAVSSLERIITESHWEEFFDKIDALLDSLPPRYGTNWSRVGKERFQRKLERASRLI